MIGPRDLFLRLFPHATATGLRAIGHPGRDAPVLVTCNYTLTVERLERVLAGHDVWLLVANSGGINVWCAAGGGHFTEHDIIAAVRAARLADRVDHRKLVLPQLAATGIRPEPIVEATGFDSDWGPARLEDLPSFLDHGCRVTRDQRTMRFPLVERLEMAAMWAPALTGITLAVVASLLGLASGALAAATVLAMILAVFVALPHLRVIGAIKWLTFAAVATIAVGAAAGALALAGALASAPLVATAIACAAALAVLSIDLAGTTPWYPSSINSLGNHFDVELLEDKCTGAADCVKVCPSDVLAMDGHRRKVVLAHPAACILCGACIVQCPEDALRFRFRDGRVVEPEVVRTTKVNLLGRRTIPAPGPRPER